MKAKRISVMRSRWRRIVLCGFMAGFCVSSALSAEKPQAITLASKGSSFYTIVVSGQAGDVEKFAAGELQTYLKKISGATLPIRDDSGNTSPMIRLVVAGKKPLPEGVEFRADDAEYDAFIIRTVGKDLYLIGSNERGAIYAVYTLLEKHLGCRWPSFGIEKDLNTYRVCEELVPTREVIALGPIDETHRAGMKYRGMVATPWFGNFPWQIADWMGKNRMNYVLFGIAERYEIAKNWREEVAEVAMTKRGIIIDAGHHSFNFFVPPGEYFEKHPEYFALIEGKRKTAQHGAQLCVTNPEVADIYVRNVVAFGKRHPEVQALTLFPNDGFGWCECDNCRKLAPDPWILGKEWRNVTDLYQQFMNTVVPRIRKELPGVKLLRGAYINYGQVPARVKPGPGIDVSYALYERNWTTEPLDVLKGVVGEYTRGNLKDWAAALKDKGDLIIYSYYNGGKYAVWIHRPLVEVMGREIPYFRKLGASGCLIPAYWGAKDICAVNTYAFARYCWDAKEDPETVLNEYCSARYGKAAPVMAKYFKELEKNATRHLKYFVRTPEQKAAQASSMTKLQEFLDDARTAEPDEGFRKVFEIEQGLLDKFKAWQLREGVR